MKRRLNFIFAVACLALLILPAQGIPLSLDQARQLAAAKHPRITAAELRTLAAKQEVAINRSQFLPQITANATAVGTSQDNTRIAAGALSNPGIYERNAEGINISQLITDFGRTANLTASAKYRARAEEESQEATREQILFLVDSAYFDALRSGAVLNVAHQTVSTRQLLLDQVSALTSNKLKSELDLNFAKVSLDEGKLLELRAQNDLQASFARLSTLLGYNESEVFQLEDVPLSTNVPPDISGLVATALESRPELIQLRFEKEGALKFAKAEKALHYPTISAVGSAGVIPFRDEGHFEDYYAAAGVNLSLPLYAGGLHQARKKEAEYRAKVVEENLHDRENEVIRDVRIAWLSLKNSLERMDVTQKLLDHAIQAYNLAEARYRAGGTSIVELSQAQLNRTSAEITAATAKFEYQIQQSLLAFETGANPIGRQPAPK